MGKILALLCMLIITAGIFFGPKLYFENIDTRLWENRQDYRYSVKIEGDLELSEKKEMLLNYDCLIDIENTVYELDWKTAKGINEMINEIYFEDPNAKSFFKNINVGDFPSESMCFKLIYVDDEVIKTILIGTYIFDFEDSIKGVALYDAVTYDVYMVYVVGGHWNQIDKLAGYKSIFEPEEILNGRTINNILEKTSLKAKYVFYEDFEGQEINMLDLFKLYLNENINDMSERPADSIFKED